MTSHTHKKENQNEDDIIFEEEISSKIKPKKEDEEFLDDVEYEEEISKDTIKKLKRDIQDLKKKADENLLGWQRTRADYANLQKITNEEKKELKSFVLEQIVYDLLPTLDSFQMAMSNKVVWESVDENWRRGIEYIYQQLEKTLADHGLQRIQVQVGEVYNPEIHQILETVVDTNKNDNTIESVIQIGYKIGDRIVRPARVNVYTKE